MTETVPLDVDLRLHGRHVHDWRLFRGLTQADLAGQVGKVLDRHYGQPVVAAWEAGKRRTTDPQRIAIAAVLAVPPAVLFPYPEVVDLCQRIAGF